MLAEKYLPFLNQAYKDLSQPDFGFVRRAFSARPYDPLVKRLRDYVVVEEFAQAEDDVCFSYLIKGRAAVWKLDLSLVGPFGLFVRLKSQLRPEDFLTAASQDLVDMETKIVRLLQGQGIRLLGADELSLAMPMNLYHTGRGGVHLYHALFADREGLPWS